MENPIRVLCVFSTLDRGGAESMCMQLYRHIDRNKVQFDFVKHTSNIGAFEKEITKLGGIIYEAPKFEIRNLPRYYIWWNNHLKKHPEHQIIHGHYFTISAVYFKIAKGRGRITIAHIHASTIRGRFKKHLVRNISKNADYAFACSFEAGKWVYHNRQFNVLHNAIDTNAFKYSPHIREIVKNELGLSNDLVLGTVANFSRVKNPMGLIDIFLETRKIRPNIKLVWVGDGKLRTAIEERLQKERIVDSVLLLGVRSDVPRILQAIDVFCLPSFNEGLPVSMIEAQAAGLPCCVSDTITREADITGLCRFLPIDEPDVWAKVLSKEKINRLDVSEVIKKAGYDIKDTAESIQNFYLTLSRGQLSSASVVKYNDD